MPPESVAVPIERAVVEELDRAGGRARPGLTAATVAVKVTDCARARVRVRDR